MTDQTRVAVGQDPRLPLILVDLQAYFEFAFELDELLCVLERPSGKRPSAEPDSVASAVARLRKSITIDRQSFTR
jgi:hypothetical protein